MFKFRLDADDTYLILAPRWADLGTDWQVGLLAVLLLIPLALIFWLCRYELRLVSRGAACGLLCLRVAMVLVIWFAVGVQPQVAEIRVEEMPGRVRIALDLSSSMDVADRQRTPEEKDALERVFQSPDVDAFTRRQIALRVLSPQGLNLYQRLADRHQVEIVGFHDHAVDLSASQLVDAENASRAIHATNLLAPLGNVFSSRAAPLHGILVLSDGNHNVGAPPLKRADELGKLRVPIYPVVVGSRVPPHDVMIFDVQAPTKTFKGDTVQAIVRCKVTNMPAQALTLHLQINGNKASDDHQRIMQHPGGDGIYTERFKVKMDDAGTHLLSFKATSKEPKEITLANNVATRIIRVDDDRAKVLLVDGEARWEYLYLANALLRDPKVALERVVFTQPRIGALKDAQLEQAGLPKTKLPEPKAERKDYDPLLDFDCIMLGDVAPEQLPLADRKRLERFVSERGGTLIMVAGKRHLPMVYVKQTPNTSPQGRVEQEDDPLAKMLPMTEPREAATTTGFTLRVSGAGKLRQFLQLELDGSWPELPIHYWGIVGKRKPAASVLLTPVFAKPEAKFKDDAESGIMFEQNYGFGRVVFVGIDSTWRWRFRVGDTYHHRFWGQLARWAAAEKLLPAGNRWVRYGTLEPVYAEGQEVELAARLSELLPPLKEGATAQFKLHRRDADGGESVAATIALTKHARQPNLLVAKARDLAAGTYRFELDIPAYRTQIAEPNEEKTSIVKGRDLFRIVPREQPELLDLSTNWTLLQSLADRSDGRVYTPDTVDEIVDRLTRRIERVEHRSDSKPWQDEPMVWWLLGVLLGLLTVEWVWRRWLDLA